MRIRHKLVGPISLWLFWVRLTAAQDLAPRAYIITPVHANAITLTWSFYSGGINLSGSIPITGATGTYSVPTVSLYHAFSFFGRSANSTVVGGPHRGDRVVRESNARICPNCHYYQYALAAPPS